MRADLVPAMLLFARAYRNPRYKGLVLRDCVAFAKAHREARDFALRVDAWLCGMCAAPRSDLIVEREVPHRRELPMGTIERVQRFLDNIALNVASSEHSGRSNWWRAPKSDENILHVTVALLLCIPETGEPDERCKAMIHGICDHYSDASHGPAYRGCIPIAPLGFVLDLAHELGWCQREGCQHDAT